MQTMELVNIEDVYPYEVDDVRMNPRDVGSRECREYIEQLAEQFRYNKLNPGQPRVRPILYRDGGIYQIIDGECRSNTPSTIVDLSVKGSPKLIREGPIKFDEIVEVYNQKAPSIALGCDHGAFALKEHIKSHLAEMGFDCLDEGTHSASSCDYPIFAKKVGDDVADGKAELGIVCCTSGEGVCIAANKVKGIRCGIGYDDVVTGKVREHNDGNVISFGAAYMKEEDVLRRVDIFLTEKFSSLQKHHRRVDEIE